MSASLKLAEQVTMRPQVVADQLARRSSASRGRRPAAARRDGGGRRCAWRRAAPAGPCAARRSGRGSRWSGRRRRGVAGQRRAVGERRDVHAVRDDHRVAAEVLDLHPAGEVGHRDPAADPLQPGPHDWPPGRQELRPGGGGVEGGHDRPLGDHADQQRHRRRRRLVHVDDVEVPVAQPAAHAGGRHRAELHSWPSSRCRASARCARRRSSTRRRATPRARPG